MTNKVPINKFLRSFGCRLRYGAYWSANSDDCKRIVIKLWNSQQIGDSYLLIPKIEPLPSWTKTPAFRVLQEHLTLVETECAELIGVLCRTEANSTKIEYDETLLLRLQLVDTRDGIWAKVIEKIKAESLTIKQAAQFNQSHTLFVQQHP